MLLHYDQYSCRHNIDETRYQIRAKADFRPSVIISLLSDLCLDNGLYGPLGCAQKD